MHMYINTDLNLVLRYSQISLTKVMQEQRFDGCRNPSEICLSQVNYGSELHRILNKSLKIR